MQRSTRQMRDYWNGRARENAVWFVDTTCDYGHPDMDAFFRTGPRVVSEALLDAPVRPAGRGLAVEIGSGLGRICVALAEHFDRVTGIDISEEMVQRARQLVTDERVTFVVGTGEDLQPIETGSADFVLTFTVLQHQSTPELIEAYIRESARVLKPGGVLVAQWNGLPRPTWWKARVKWWSLRNAIGGPLATDIRNSSAFAGTRFPAARMESTIRSAGMETKGTKGIGTLFSWVWAERL